MKYQINSRSINFTGEENLDFNNVPDIKKTIDNILFKTKITFENIYFDFSGIDYIDTSGLALIIFLYSKFPDGFSISNVSPAVKYVLSLDERGRKLLDL